MVIDADAILTVASLHRKLGMGVVLTPNDHEFRRLSKAPLIDRGMRIEAAKRLAARLDCVVLLKGHVSIVTDGRSVKLVEPRTAALATMGTGDVLSGIIGGYLTLNGNAFVSAVAGAYLHARIGDLLYREKGYHILASDVVEYIPRVLKRFDRTAR